MTTRKYEQRRRAAAAEETRARILEALAQRLRDAPSEPPSVDKVADLAGVARSTVYTAFGSRSGLFDAFANDLWDRSGLPELSAAVDVPESRARLRQGIAAACRMYAADLQVYRVLFSMSRVDPTSVGSAVENKERERMTGMSYLAGQLAEQGELRRGVTQDQAADLLWTLCSFEAFDLLHSGRGLSVDESARLLADTAERALCHREEDPEPPLASGSARPV